MMLITSSRKPSFKTKIICKKLALFFDGAYMTRGKMPFSEVLERGVGSALLVVGEYHGNPGSLSFYDSDSRPAVSVHFSETTVDSVSQAELRYGKKVFCGSDDSGLFKILNDFLFEGKGKAIPAASSDEIKKMYCAAPSASPSSSSPSSSSSKSSNSKDTVYVRRLYVQDDRLEFYSNDRLFLRLYVKGLKTEFNGSGELSDES